MEDQGRSLSNLALGKGIRFKAASYWLLPIWLLMEIFSGAIFGQHSGVAHWAHVGGFLFGAVVALGLRYSGLEQKANAAIEAKVTWTADPLLVQATEQMERQAGRGYCITKGIGRREARFRGGLHSAIASPLT